jgi:hypothetical protein
MSMEKYAMIPPYNRTETMIRQGRDECMQKQMQHGNATKM